MKELTITVNHDPAIRFDKAIADAVKDLRVSRAQVQRAIKAGLVTAENGVILADWPAAAAQTPILVTLKIESAASEPIQGEDIGLDIIFEDDYVLVINKPAGLVVHPGAGNWSGTLVNGLVSYLGEDVMEVGDEARPGLVHRLDKDTTGLMVVAKTEDARAYLSAQLADRSMSRVYSALCWGTPPLPQMTFDAPIGRHAKERLKMCVTGRGREAVTHIKRKAVIAGGMLTLVDCHLETGRTHQIRVHMHHAGFPVLGDPLYGLQKTAARARCKAHAIAPEPTEALLSVPRQALHARQLTFIHPQSDTPMTFAAPLPDDFAMLLEYFL